MSNTKKKNKISFGIREYQKSEAGEKRVGINGAAIGG